MWWDFHPRGRLGWLAGRWVLRRPGRYPQKRWNRGLVDWASLQTLSLGSVLFWGRCIPGRLQFRFKKGALKIPVMLRTLLFFLHERLAAGDSLQDPPIQQQSGEHDIEVFTDAKATENEAWIGGFLQDGDGNIKEWFSEKIERDWAEWLFVKNDLKRIIASLELLATSVAVRLWTGNNGTKSNDVCWVKAGTDNQSNTYAVSKMMSTKYPLTLLVMELSETLRANGCELNLQWIPREKNQLADDLTNEKFDHFPGELRRRWIGGDTKWVVLERMVFKPKEFYEDLKFERMEARDRQATGGKGKKRKLGVW